MRNFLSKYKLILAVAAAGLIASPRVMAGIRVVEDETIFTLKAPGAKQVFLVGDFNNWNPTVEKMVKKENRFEVSLFLVEGDYRYKFVVDGKWINDPDNPPKDPRQGSPLFLEELGGIIVLKDLSSKGLATGPEVKSSVRYIGAFFWEEGEDFEADQLVDVNLGVEARTFFSNATFNTKDKTWKLSPLKSEVVSFKGRFETQLRKATITAFESDTVWTSSDPFALIGNAGIYGYGFGYRERGAAIDLPLSKKLGFKAVYADRIGGGSTLAPETLSGALTGFMGSSRTDTTVYSYRPDFGGADIFGMDVRLELGDYEVGYVRRHNRGFHPGLLSRIEKRDTLFETTTFSTREQWNVFIVWAGAKINGSARVAFGFGRGETFLRRLNRSISVRSDLFDVDIGRDVEPWDSQERIQDSRRFLGWIDCGKGGFHCRIGAERSMYDFEPGVFVDSSARLLNSEINAEYRIRHWDGWITLFYSDRDYGASPDNFIFESPARNYWLDGEDLFRPETIAAIDLETYSLFRFGLSWNRRGVYGGKRTSGGVLSSGAFSRKTKSVESVYGKTPVDKETSTDGVNTPRFSLHTEMGAVAGGMFEFFEHGFAEIFLEQFFYERFYFQADSRGVLYEKTAWGGRKTFLSGYLEAGYRSERIELSLGFGFDPVVRDPIRNVYFNIGRTEFLRKAVFGAYGREAAADIGNRLLDLERLLEKNRSLKLECILLF